MSPRKTVKAEETVMEAEQSPSTEKLDHQAETACHTEKTSNPDEAYAMIIESGEASKLSPKSDGKIIFQLARHREEDKNYLRIDSNESGGLHSREWIDVQLIIDTLTAQTDQPFKSTLLKACMTGKSANNASFLAAILRSPEVKLIRASEKSPFIHVLADEFEKAAADLLARSPQ